MRNCKVQRKIVNAVEEQKQQTHLQALTYSCTCVQRWFKIIVHILFLATSLTTPQNIRVWLSQSGRRVKQLRMVEMTQNASQLELLFFLNIMHLKCSSAHLVYFFLHAECNICAPFKQTYITHWSKRIFIMFLMEAVSHISLLVVQICHLYSTFFNNLHFYPETQLPY